jgi:hypothetical protein
MSTHSKMVYAAPTWLRRAVTILLASTAAATVHGLLTAATWPATLPSYLIQIAVALVSLLMMSAITARFGWSRSTPHSIWARLSACFVFFTLLGVSASIGLPKIGALILLSAGAWVLGRRLYAPRHPGANALRLLLGLALFAAAMGWTLGLKIHVPGLYYLVLFTLIWLDRQALLDACLRLSQKHLALLEYAKAPRRALVVILTTFTVALVATPSFYPTVSADDLNYHQGLAADIVRYAQYRFDLDDQIWACAPWAHDVLHAALMLLAGEDARGALGLLWQLLFCVLANGLLLAFDIRSIRTRALAILVTISQPVWSALGVSLQSEAPSAVILLALAMLHVRQQGRFPVATGVLAGFALALKVSNIVFLAPLALLWLVSRPSWKELGLACVYAIFAGAASYFFAFVLTGNPFYPLPFLDWPTPAFTGLVNPLFDFDLPWFWPYELMFSTQRYLEVFGAASGLMWLLGLPLLLLAIHHKQTRALCICMLVSIGVLFSDMHYLRYIMPGLMLLSLLPCVALFQLHGQSVLRRYSPYLLMLMIAIQIGLQQNSSWVIYNSPLAYSFWQDRHRATNKFLTQSAPGLMPVMALAKSAEPVQPMLDQSAALFAGQAINLSWHSADAYARWLAVLFAKPQEQQAKMEALLDHYQPTHFFYSSELPEPIQAALSSRGTSAMGEGFKPYWVLRWPQILPIMEDRQRGVITLSRVSSPIARIDLTVVCGDQAQGVALALRYLHNGTLIHTDAKWRPCISNQNPSEASDASQASVKRLAHFQWTTRARAAVDTIAFEIQGDITQIQKQQWEILNSDFAAGNYRRKAFAWVK